MAVQLWFVLFVLAYHIFTKNAHLVIFNSADFVMEVIGEPAVLAGNSLGGYSVVQAAAAERGIAR